MQTLSMSDFYPTQIAATNQQPEKTTLDIKIFQRRLKVLEYRQEGLTDAQICEKLRKNDQIEVSLRTIWEDRHSIQAQDFFDELLRQQTNDIKQCDEIELRLTYRQNLITMLCPNKKAAVEVNVTNQTNTKNEVNQLIKFSRAIHADDNPTDPEPTA